MPEIPILENKIAALDQDVKDSRVNIHALRDQVTEMLSRSYLQIAQVNERIIKLENALAREKLNGRWTVLLVSIVAVGLIAMVLSRKW